MCKKPPLRPIITTHIFEKIFFDFTYLPEDRKNGDKYLLVMVDHFSKFTWMVPFSNRGAEAVADALDDMLSLEGAPKAMQADNGGEFKNYILDRVAEVQGVKYGHGRAYHPQSQGVVERKNAVIKNRVRCFQQSDT